MLPSVDSLLACLFMADPPRGYSTAIPVSTLLWMLLLPVLLAFLPADASVANTDNERLENQMQTPKGTHQLSGPSNCRNLCWDRIKMQIWKTLLVSLSVVDKKSPQWSLKTLQTDNKYQFNKDLLKTHR